MIKKESILDNLLELDWNKIRNTANSTLDVETSQVLFMQTVANNARNGYSLFQQRRFPNVTIDDVVRALKKKPEDVKTTRQKLITEFFTWVESALLNEKKNTLLDRSGKPLYGITPLKKFEVNVKDVLRGIYLWCSLLTKDYIEKAEKKFSRNIGWGSYYLVDMQQLAKHGINGDDLEHFNHDDMIDFYREINLITNPEMVWHQPAGRIKYLFIRHSLGAGISVDLAIVSAGIIYNRDVSLGILLSHMLLTLSKYVHQYNDFNADIKDDIERKIEDLELGEDEILNFINLVVVPEDENRDIIPHSSVLDLFTASPKSGVYPLESYLAFIDRKHTVPTHIGMNRILSLDFFRYVNKALLESKSIKSLPQEDYIKLNLALPASNFASDNYIVLQSGKPIAVGINEMIRTKKDVLIVVNEKGKLTGVLTSADIVRLFEN